MKLSLRCVSPAATGEGAIPIFPIECITAEGALSWSEKQIATSHQGQSNLIGREKATNTSLGLSQCHHQD